MRADGESRERGQSLSHSVLGARAHVGSAQRTVAPWRAVLFNTVPVNGGGVGWEFVDDGDSHGLANKPTQLWAGILVIDDGDELLDAIWADDLVGDDPRLFDIGGSGDGGCKKRGRRHGGEEQHRGVHRAVRLFAGPVKESRS